MRGLIAALVMVGACGQVLAQDVSVYHRYDNTSGYSKDLVLDADCLRLQEIHKPVFSDGAGSKPIAENHDHESLLIVAAVNCVLFELKAIKEYIGMEQ